MDLKNVNAFIHVAETNSFTRAAERLEYAQSTITAQIQTLEAELGAELFIRRGKRISLSVAGQMFLPYAYQFQALHQDVHARFSRDTELSGEYRIGILESISTASYMDRFAQFMREYPKVNLMVTIDTTLHLLQRLRNGELSMVWLIDRPVNAADIRVVHESSVPIVFFCAPSHPFATSSPVPIEQLSEVPWILAEKGTNYRWQLEQDLAARHQYIRARIEIGSTSNIIDFVAKDLGVSLLPSYTLKQAIDAGRIVPFQIKGYDMHMQSQFLVFRKRWIPEAIAKLMSYF